MAIKLTFNYPFTPFFLVIVFLLSSCVKPPGKIGSEIQPEQSKLQVEWSDTTTVLAYSLADDTIRTDETTVNLLGSMMDPVFGSTVAGFYTQFKLSAAAPDFGENPVLDSLVLQLSYRGDSYGDTNTILVAHAYEMLDGIDFLSEYYSNTVVPVAATDYANFQFVPRPSDSLIFIDIPTDSTLDDTVVAAPALRIRLSDETTELGYRFLTADTADLKDSEAFIEFFKGLFIVTEPVSQGGSISYFDLVSSKSVMVMYYHEVFADSVSPPKEFSFIISQFTPRFNKYEHDFTFAESEFKNQVVNRDTLLGRQKFYVQGVAGVKTIVKFPNIHDWANVGNIAINEAKLIFSGFEAEPFNGAPGLLALVEIQEDGTYKSLIDEAEGQFYFDGTYKSSLNSFTFRITRYIQSLIDDTTKVDKGLYMFVRGESVVPERFIFNGNQPVSDTALPFRLEIIYTDLN